jgi:lysophospholipase L1-like esterase
LKLIYNFFPLNSLGRTADNHLKINLKIYKMKNRKILSAHLIGLIISLIFLSGCDNQKVKLVSLKVEMQENPIGIGTPNPRFSWQITSVKPDLQQKSYQIQVALSEENLKNEENLIWDSGIIEDDKSVLIPFKGEELKSGLKYYWRLRVSTNQGDTDWSKINTWSMALLNESDWKAKWIGEDSMSNPGETDKGNTRLAARYLRKPFTLKNNIERAVLYISGQGVYEAYINGEKISEDVLSPTVSWYPDRVYYNVYDVTPLLKRNDNILGVILGNGRYFGMREVWNQLFGLPRLLAQLEVVYSDGSTDTIISDETWRVTSKGPIVANNEFDGEEYDARLEIVSWNLANFNDSGWKNADIMEAPGGIITAQPNPNIRVQDELTPIKITELGEGKLILDMGQNMVGWLKINSLTGKKDQPIKFRFAEEKQYINRGISGQTTPQMLLRFRQDVLNLWPKVVVILAGVNDIAGNTGPSSLEMIEDNIHSMTELAQAHGIQVVLCSVLPAYDFPWRPGLEPAPKIVELNRRIKEYASKKGAVYCDYFSAMADERNGLPEELSGDGVHPNKKGYEIMQPIVENAIARALIMWKEFK